MNIREKSDLYDAIKIAGKSEEEYVKQVKVWKDKAKLWDKFNLGKVQADRFERLEKLEQDNKNLEDANEMWKERAEGFTDLVNRKADVMVENEELKEDSKKYKLLMSANSQVVKDNITMSEYQEEINNLKFRLADEQDENNRINGERRRDAKIVEEIREFVKLSPEPNHYTKIKEIIKEKPCNLR